MKPKTPETCKSLSIRAILSVCLVTNLFTSIAAEPAHSIAPAVIAGKAAAKIAVKKGFSKKLGAKKAGKGIKNIAKKGTRGSKGGRRSPQSPPKKPQSAPSVTKTRKCRRVIGIKACFKRNRVLDEVQKLGRNPNVLRTADTNNDGLPDHPYPNMLHKVVTPLGVDMISQMRDRHRNSAPMVTPDQMVDDLEAADADPKGKWQQVSHTEAAKSAQEGQLVVMGAPGNQQFPQGHITIVLPQSTASQLVVVQLGANGQIGGSMSADRAFGPLKAAAKTFVFVNKKENVGN
jgi:hypothetical protein